MKIFIKTLGFVAVLAFALIAAPVRAQDDTSVSFQTFYDQLADQGTWVQTADYGYVFQPTVSDSNWRPYTYGHWVHTDAGMTWDSDEPFGWATYHYGRWVNLDGYGWVWVPGHTWAPAWVSWRDNDDYVGWAPLPPETAVGIDFFDPDVSIGFGFHIGGDCDVAFGIGPAYYNFCPVAYFGDPFAWRHFASPGDNFVIINNTTNITNINVNGNLQAGAFARVNAAGPSLATLNGRTLTPIQQASLTTASSPATAGLRGNTLATFAPKINPATVTAARPGSVSTTLAKTSVNRGTSINSPLAVNSRLGAASATPQQIQAATQAQGKTSAGAKIAAANASPSRPLTKSLTSLQTSAPVGAKSNATTSASVKPTTATGANAGSSTSATGGAKLKPNAAMGANAGSSASATGGAKLKPNAAMGANVSSSTSATGGAKLKPNAAMGANAGSSTSATGGASHRHTTAAASAESTFTGAPTTRHTLAPSRSAESTYTGAPTTRHTLAPSNSSSGGSSYHPQQSAPAFHSSAPAYHPQQSAPAFHSSAPAYHPQSSSQSSAAPAQHMGGSAPAAHVSGGGQPSGGGGKPSGKGDKPQH